MASGDPKVAACSACCRHGVLTIMHDDIDHMMMYAQSAGAISREFRIGHIYCDADLVINCYVINGASTSITTRGLL